jgi:hypothetical protein
LETLPIFSEKISAEKYKLVVNTLGSPTAKGFQLQKTNAILRQTSYRIENTTYRKFPDIPNLIRGFRYSGKISECDF